MSIESPDENGMSGDTRVCIESNEKDFLLQEYAFRRQDILERIERIETQLKYGLLASGSIWIWVLSNDSHDLIRVVVWLPVVIVVFFTASWSWQDAAIRKIAAYCETVEAEFLPPGEGWENHCSKLRDQVRGELCGRKLSESVRGAIADPLATLTYVFWIFIVAANIIGASLLTF